MSDRESMYRLVLRAYPPAFRRAFDQEMLKVYRAQRRDGVVDTCYWLACIADAAATAPRLWMDELRDGYHATSGAMKTMSILAALVGLLEIANSLIELRASPLGDRDMLAQTVLALVIATGGLLTVAGVALLFRGRDARLFGSICAGAAVGTFTLMLATRPMMSIAATSLGIVVPLALCLFLLASRANATTHRAA